MTRQEIIKQVKVKLKEIDKIQKSINALRIKAYQLNDNKSTYKEELETRGRGKSKKTETIGRIYFNQKFKDGSTGQYFKIERSKVVRVNKKWIL